MCFLTAYSRDSIPISVATMTVQDHHVTEPMREDGFFLVRGIPDVADGARRDGAHAFAPSHNPTGPGARAIPLRALHFTA